MNNTAVKQTIDLFLSQLAAAKVFELLTGWLATELVIFDYFGCDLRYLIIWTSCDWRYLTAVAQFSERLGLAEAGDSAGLGEARTVRSPVGPQPGPTGVCC